MVNGKWWLAACCALVVGLVGSSVGAWNEPSRTMFLTFNRPVGLPGVALGSWTYIFELADPQTSGGWNMVRVLSRDRKRVHYTGFTNIVDRPDGLPTSQVLSFGEARPDVPQPILAWYPRNEPRGRQFIYLDKK